MVVVDVDGGATVEDGVVVGGGTVVVVGAEGLTESGVVRATRGGDAEGVTGGCDTTGPTVGEAEEVGHVAGTPWVLVVVLVVGPPGPVTVATEPGDTPPPGPAVPGGSAV